jgi:exopolysaccharide biosynthesis predicted pyruvyltransferase EpsI
MSSTDLPGLYGTQLREALAPLVSRARPAALVGFPDGPNCGEHATWLGETRLLAELGASIAYHCSAQSYDREAMAAKLGSGMILLHGALLDGALMTRVLQDFPDHPAIVFPQQPIVRDTERLGQLAAAVAGRSEIVMFARSASARDLLKRQCGQSARVELAPDAAFLLGSQPRAREAIFDILWIARTDQERTDQATEEAARLSSQPAEKFVLPPFADGVEIHCVVKQRPPTVLLTDWSSLVFENEDARLAYRRLDFAARSQAYVDRGLYLLSLGRIVITDRLHAHILCLLLGIPHVLLDTASGRSRDFYETWTRQTDLCRLARNPAEAWSLARKALAKLKEAKEGDSPWENRADAPPRKRSL